jgi:predicted dehydrogenase
MKALVIGFGSIGQRHARLLKSLGCELAVVSAQPIKDYPVYRALPEALQAFLPDHVVICTVTSAHAESLNQLKKLDYRGKVLVEKPLFSHGEQNGAPYPFKAHIAYQLRFHPMIIALHEALAARKPLSAHIYVGQHLSQWRPGRDHKATYSAHRAQGGGVLRDLSHELDLIGHIFGSIEVCEAIGARAGDVTVDSEDAVACVLRCRHCPVISLQMNYLDHVPRREWIVNTPDASIKVDLIGHTLTINTTGKTIAYDSDDAYLSMHRAWLADNTAVLCKFEEALALVKLMDKVAV